LGDDGLEQVWSLVGHSTHQQTSIRATMDGQSGEETNSL